MAHRFFVGARVWMMIGCFGLALACSAEDTQGVSPSESEATGTLALPLKTTGSSGAVYYLVDAVFLIRDEGGNPVAALSTAGDPEAQVLSINLTAGRYTVELQDGWTLMRRVDGNLAPVTATLLHPPVVEVVVIEDAEAGVVFGFRTAIEDLTFKRGTLEVLIAVEETAVCGNGIMEEGEVCDSGPDNGRPNRCDATCTFRCERACPLRVDPGATVDGDGSSWESPLRYVQEAIDIQHALGGGNVWVRGPGPYALLSGVPFETLIRLKTDVQLIGGFDGTEQRIEDYTGAGQTIILGANAVDDLLETTPLISVDSRTLLDHFVVRDHLGVVLKAENAQYFVVGGFDVVDSSHLRSSQIQVLDSIGTFGGLHVRDSNGIDGDSGLHIERSEVQINNNSDFTGLRTITGVAGVSAEDSRLLLSDVSFSENDTGGIGQEAGLLLRNSEALLIRTSFQDNRSEGPVFSVRGSLLFAVDSHWENHSSTGPVLVVDSGSTASFLNSSFVRNQASSAGVLYTAGDLEVVNATFWENEVNWPTDLYPEDIGTAGGVVVRLYNSYSNNGARSVYSYTGSGNCLLDDNPAPFVNERFGYTQVFLTTDFGCTDIGNDDAAREAAADAQAFADTFGAVSPLQSDWWQDSGLPFTVTSVYPLCEDAGPIDPGRHHRAFFCE